MENKSVLDEAKEIIYGDREKTYGHPSKNLEVIARMWSAYLFARDVVCEITPQDVAVMMVLLKTARLGNQPDHHDSLVDGAGYLALVERCKERV